MAPCYVVFHGKQPGIYHTWYECSEQVLGVQNARHKKYSSYEQAVRDFNALVGALTPPPDLFQSQTGATMAPVHGKNVVAPVHGKTTSWNTVIIVTLLLLVFGL